MLIRSRRRRHASRPGGKVRGDGGAPKAGEDSAKEEDGEEEPRRPGQVGKGATRVMGEDGGRPVAWRGGKGAGGSVDDGFREAGGGGESRGMEDGVAAESSGRGG
jgi:hypothetical protein